MTRPQALLAATLALLFVVLSAGCADEPRPNVVLVTIDSFRWDDAEALRGDRPLAPAYRELAAESLVFDRALSAAPWTTPAMMTIFTGLDAAAHGVEEHDRQLASSVPTLAERFREAGYRTAGIAPAVTLKGTYGFERGFELYDFEDFGHLRVSSPSLSGKLMHRIEQWAGEPFFAWVHLWDPHYNYVPPPPHDGYFERGDKPDNEDVQCLKWVERPVSESEADYLRGQFEGEVHYTDLYLRQIVETLESAGLRENTILVVSADHGEAFMEKGWLGHTNRLDDTLIRVPMLFSWPGRIEAGRVEDTVSNGSIGATLLALAGLADEEEPFGELPPLPVPGLVEPPAPADEAEELVLARTLRRGCFVSATGERFKYVLDFRSCGEELFDVEADPYETRDLAALRPEETARMRALLGQRLESVRALGIPRATMPAAAVEEAEQMLRSIGYVQGGGAEGEEGEVACALLTRPKGVDAFGDAIVDEPCREERIETCFAELAAGAPESR